MILLNKMGGSCVGLALFSVSSLGGVPLNTVSYEGESNTIEIVEVEDEPNPSVSALAGYLESKGAYGLAKYAKEIMELPRWQEVLAITGKETSFCQAGVGKSQNNCGGIMSPREDRLFKIYNTTFDSVVDIAYLLQKPRYKGKSLEEMNGVYCVDEARADNKCDLWTEHIDHYIEEIGRALSTG